MTNTSSESFVCSNCLVVDKEEDIDSALIPINRCVTMLMYYVVYFSHFLFAFVCHRCLIFLFFLFFFWLSVFLCSVCTNYTIYTCKYVRSAIFGCEPSHDQCSAHFTDHDHQIFGVVCFYLCLCCWVFIRSTRANCKYYSDMNSQ